MAISHSLSLATPLPTDQVALAVRDIAVSTGLLQVPVEPGEFLDDGVSTNSGTWIRVLEPTVQPWDPLITDLGIRPTVRVAFRLDKTTDLSGQADEIIRLVSQLLAKIPGDAVLQYLFETIWLLRRGNDLTLNEDDDLWPAQRLTLLTQPYRRETYTFSEE
ncbi:MULTISPECIES: SitI3 family protein [Streptacidiphilus]|uniref:SitI3 family protein n=1 Tax=Streptacidiphilus cavernicola TaxID=3342716 RepID=A0ABV6UGT1_9ACTN|nr:SitI3 family protein [Streptacidiphilus jeojiense]